MQVQVLSDDLSVGQPSMTVELAYCAGVIDSDGSISVKRSTYSMRVVGDSKQPTFSERITVRQVEPEAVHLLKSLFGGYLGIHDPSCKRGRSLYSWQVTDKKAAECLRALLPYLRIKKQQAINCLELRAVKDQSRIARVAIGRGHAGAASRPSTLSAAMQQHFERAKYLNAVGVR